MTSSPAWTFYWLVWTVVMFTSFIVPEVIALATNSHNTLSYQVWNLESMTPGNSGPIYSWTAVHFLVGGIFLVLFTWLIFHFILGWFH